MDCSGVHREGSAPVGEGQPQRPGRDGQIFSLRPRTAWSSSRLHGPVPPHPPPTDRDRLSWPLVWLVAAVRRHVDASARRRKLNVPRVVRRGRSAWFTPRLAHLQSPPLNRVESTPDTAQGATGRVNDHLGLSANHAACHKSGGSHLRACAGTRGRHRSLQMWLSRRVGDGRGSVAGVTSARLAHPRACDGWPPWLWEPPRGLTCRGRATHKLRVAKRVGELLGQ